MPQGPDVVQFGPFELNTVTAELRRDGRPVALAPQPARILALLATQPGRLVTREEIRLAVWTDAVHVDYDRALNFALKQIREALDDDATRPRYVETLRGRGYRFVAPVEPPSPEATAIHAPPRRRWIAAAALGAVLATGAWAWRAASIDSDAANPVRIAVLPFENLSGDPDQEYFSDGLTDEMITQLASLSPGRLGVVARTSAMLYKRTRKGAAEIGRELGVDYILEGSVRRSGDRVRISAQLIRAESQTHVWAEHYDRAVDDILNLQSDVARAIARELSLQLSRSQESRLAASRPVVPQAYEAYLRGRYFWNQRTKEAFEKALVSFQDALGRQPRYAEAYSGIADTYILLGYYSILPPHQAYPRAKAAALAALEIDPTLAEAHSSLAGVYVDYEWAWDEAEAAYTRALQLNPGYAVAHQWYANYLSAMGRSREAISEALQAKALDPLSPIVTTNVSWVYHLARQYDRAVEEARQALELDADFYAAHLVLGRAYLEQAMPAEAIASFRAAAALSGENSMVLGELGHAYGASGDRASAEAVLAQLSRREYAPPFEIALIHVGMGQKDQALAWLERAHRERARALGFANVEPRLDAVRGNRRFQELVRRLGLPALPETR
jgi:TolB-like protein/DNA-binding winged helix-turn-helix (wHTH) protein/Tfp pilus assembly protein PilF